MNKVLRKVYNHIQYPTVDILLYPLVGVISELNTINMVNHSDNHKPLHDLGFQLIPHVEPAYADYMVGTLVFYFILRWLFTDMKKLYKFANIMTWILVFRFFTVNSTILPYPVEDQCICRKAGDPIRWDLIYYLSKHHQYACYDLMFSGHIAHASLIWVFTLIYVKNNYEKTIITFLTLLSGYLIIASRSHYTSDTIMGYMMSLLYFCTYRTIKKWSFYKKHSNIIKHSGNIVILVMMHLTYINLS
jgi:hypothetical protein